MGKLRYNIALIVANVLFGANFSFYVSLTKSTVSFQQIFILQLTVAALLFIPVALLKKRTYKITLEDFGTIFIVALIVVYGWMYMLLWGASQTNPIDASMIATLGPVFTLIVAYIINPQSFSWIKSIALIGLGFGLLVYGADITLDSAVKIATSFGISERVIGITLLAGGTSLPELAASLVAASKGHGALAFGNVIGSNIANILLILGSCATITPLCMSGITRIDLLVLFGSVVMLVISALLFGHRKITRAEGLAFLVAYGLYVWYLIN